MDGWGDNKRVFDMSDVISEMDEDSQQALIGLHAFTVQATTTALPSSEKGKKHAWH